MPTTSQQDRELTDILMNNMSISLDASIILDWVAEAFTPEDIFSREELSHWAWDNGFVEEEEEKGRYMIGGI